MRGWEVPIMELAALLELSSGVHYLQCKGRFWFFAASRNTGCFFHSAEQLKGLQSRDIYRLVLQKLHQMTVRSAVQRCSGGTAECFQREAHDVHKFPCFVLLCTTLLIIFSS